MDHDPHREIYDMFVVRQFNCLEWNFVELCAFTVICRDWIGLTFRSSWKLKLNLNIPLLKPRRNLYALSQSFTVIDREKQKNHNEQSTQWSMNPMNPASRYAAKENNKEISDNPQTWLEKVENRLYMLTDPMTLVTKKGLRITMLYDGEEPDPSISCRTKAGR
jgi:hypothetical protein